MFLDIVDLDGDGLKDLVVADRGGRLLWLRRQGGEAIEWEPFPIQKPANSGVCKAVRAGDINGDGKLDIVFSCAAAEGGRSGVLWLSYRKSVADFEWDAHEISGPEGIKYDLVELLDLDGDGDLDVLTCEERTNLGVIWYENPTRK
jgi:hypothetical protein